MTKTSIGFFLICSIALMACQLQYLVSGQPTSNDDTPPVKSTATVQAGSSGSSARSAASPAAPQATTVTAIVDVAVRIAPLASAQSVSQIPKGTDAQVVGRAPANDWFQVMIFSGLTMTPGWVPANQVTLNGALDSIPVIQPEVLPPASSSKAGLPTPTRQTYPSSSQPVVPTPTRKTYP
jgi:hypothetical protein